MSGYIVGDLVAEFLERCGVRTLFGVVSVHNLPMLDAVARRGSARFVAARGEMGAGHMADGFARAGGSLGVVVTSTGPGAANVCPALVEAEFAGTPLLHLTGQSPTRWIGRGQGALHDVPDQLGMLRAVSKAAYRVRSPGEALGVLTRAAVEALSGRPGPVSVEIPFDIQRMAVDRPPRLDDFELPLPPPRLAAAAELDQLAARVARARRPVLWAGNGARHAADAVRQLADLGFAVVNSLSAQGIAGEHPMALGSLNGGREPQIEDFYDRCDLMIVAGSRLRLFETRDGEARLPKNLVRIDTDPAADGRTYANTGFVCGDSAHALGGLAARLQGRWEPDPAFRADVAATGARVREALRASLGPYADFPRQMRAAMPADALWVRDATLSNGAWGNRLFPLAGPRDGMFPIGAAIGPGLPLGIGAALAANPQGRKVVMMAGDGGFAVNLPELWTAAQEKLALVVVVMNDGGYGVIRHIQDLSYGGRHAYTQLLQPDYAGLAALAGMPFWRVSAADGLEQAMREALAVDAGPAFVEVDMARIGEFPRYIVPQK